MAAGLVLLAVLFVLRFRIVKLKTRGILIAIGIVAVLLLTLMLLKGLYFKQVRPPHRRDIPFL